MKKKIGLSILLILVIVGALILFVPSIREVAEITYLNLVETTEFVVSGDKVYMNGEINSKTPKQLKEVINNNPEVKTIVMLEVPGSLDDEANIPMAEWVREKGLNTYITENSLIASGGVDFFLAGNKRSMEKGAKLGVHSWKDSSGVEAKDLPKEHIDHEMNRKYIENMLGKDDFYWYTIYAAPANDIYYMNMEEIEKYNILTEPIIENPVEEIFEIEPSR